MGTKIQGQNLKLTDDPLTNIEIMAPLLDEKGQASVYGLIYGLLMSGAGNGEGSKDRKITENRREPEMKKSERAESREKELMGV